jgi:GH43 family beta-xylosidase
MRVPQSERQAEQHETYVPGQRAEKTGIKKNGDADELDAGNHKQNGMKFLCRAEDNAAIIGHSNRLS